MDLIRKQKQVIFTTTLCLLILGIQAQITFTPGYLINSAGDTLKGEVKLNSKKEHEYHHKLVFKDGAGAQKSYKPEKIKGYGFQDNHFMAVNQGSEWLYYKRLVSGNIHLYKSFFEVTVINKSTMEPEYFLFKEGDKKYTEVKEHKFKKQLQEWMKDKPELADDYKDEKKLDETSAIKILQEYNLWKDSLKE